MTPAVLLPLNPRNELNMEISPEQILFLPVLLFSLICHELGHAWVAWRGGDDTARLAGRITMNPVAHIDPIGTVLLPILQVFTHVPLIGWAKPVPVNPANLRSREWDLAVSLAGVTINFVLALLGAILLKILILSLDWMPQTLPEESTALFMVRTSATLLRAMVMVNLFLMIFNLLPIPPLDGSHVLFYFIRRPGPKLEMALDFFQRFGFFMLLILVFSGAFFYILGPVMEGILSIIRFVLRIPPFIL